MTVKDLKDAIKNIPEDFEIKLLLPDEAFETAYRVKNAAVITNLFFDSDDYEGLYLFGQ